MSAGDLTQFSCEQCNRAFKWKPELAGKRVKCKCGVTITVPAPPAAEPEPVAVAETEGVSESASGGEGGWDQGFDALAALAATGPVDESAPVGAPCPSCGEAIAPGAVVCTACGYDARTGKKRVAKAAASIPQTTDGVGAAAGVLPYRNPLAAAVASKRQEGVFVDPAKDLYLPLALLCAGFVAAYFEAVYGFGLPHGAFAMAYVAACAFVNIVLVFLGILAAVRLLELGLGPIGPALLKIAAIAVLPGAVAGVIGGVLRVPFVGWAASLILTYVMYMGLLDLDGKETGICTCLVWLVRTWLSIFLIIGLLGLFKIELPNRSAAASGATSGLIGGDDGYQQTVEQLNAELEERIKPGSGGDADAWLQNDKCYIYGLRDNAKSKAFVKQLHDMGAPTVWVSSVFNTENRGNSASVVIVTLPTDRAKRKKIFEWHSQREKKLQLEKPTRDRGQKYLEVIVERNEEDGDAAQ